MTQTSIIIPTLYPSSHLLEYAERIRGFSDVKEVIIVINTDQRVLKQAQNSTIKVLALGKNKGFTGACNAGARASTGKYLLFLNDDCEMDEENFKKLVQFLEKNPELVATQPIVYRQNPNPNIQIPSSDSATTSRHPGIVQDQTTDLSDSGQARMTNPPSRYTLDATPSKEIENIGFVVDTKVGKAHAIKDLAVFQNKQYLVSNVYGLSGTCLLIRKDIFDKVGMWDASFHSYLEDVDLALRMRKFGYKFAPCLTASVTHAHMSTSSKMGIYKPMRDMINWWRLIIKHPNVFIHTNNLIPILLERARNLNGILKSLKTIHAQP